MYFAITLLQILFFLPILNVSFLVEPTDEEEATAPTISSKTPGISDKETSANGTQELPLDTHTSPWWKRVLFESSGPSTKRMDSLNTEPEKRRLLFESKFWKNVVNANAAVAMGVLCFLCGYFC